MLGLTYRGDRSNRGGLGMDWVKIEPGCEMPRNGEVVLAVIKVDSHGQLSRWFQDAVFYEGGFRSRNGPINPIHWARVELPNN